MNTVLIKTSILISLAIIIFGCNSKPSVNDTLVTPIDSLAIDKLSVDSATDNAKFHLAFDSQPVTYSIRSLAGLDSAKHYHYIIKSSERHTRNEVIINNRRLAFYSTESHDSIDYIGPYNAKTFRPVLSYEDSTICDCDTLLFHRGIRNYIIRYPSYSDIPIDTIEISRDRVYRAEARDLYNKDYRGSLYGLTPLSLYRIVGDTVEFHFGYYIFDTDVGDLYRYRITNYGDTFFIDEDYYRKYGNAPFGIEPEE